MGRCCNGLMVAFRVVQLILSFVALACAAFIVQQMLSLSDTAADLQTLLQYVVDAATSTDSQDDDENILKFQKVLNHVLDFFQGTPARAITLSAVGAWSIIVIIYLLVAQAKAAKRPAMNTRMIRITLEVFTLFFWIAGIACAALLAVQFGPIGIIGGPHAKLMVPVLRKIILRNMSETTSRDDKAIDDSLSFVDDLITIGLLALLAAGASLFCGMVQFVSCIAACCISGKAPSKKTSPQSQHFYNLEKGYHAAQAEQQPPLLPKKDNTFYSVQEVGTPNSWISTPSTPGFQGQAYHAVSSYDHTAYHHPRYAQPRY